MGPVVPCERNHWGIRWSSQLGHDLREGCAEMGAVVPCDRRFMQKGLLLVLLLGSSSSFLPGLLLLFLLVLLPVASGRHSAHIAVRTLKYRVAVWPMCLENKGAHDAYVILFLRRLRISSHVAVQSMSEVA